MLLVVGLEVDTICVGLNLLVSEAVGSTGFGSPSANLCNPIYRRKKERRAASHHTLLLCSTCVVVANFHYEGYISAYQVG